MLVCERGGNQREETVAHSLCFLLALIWRLPLTSILHPTPASLETKTRSTA